MTDRNTTPDDRTTSILDRRREKVRAAKAAADAARQRVSELDEHITHTITRAQQHETALQQALDEVDRHKKALKASAKQQERLRAARRKAQAAAAKVSRKRQVAEARYDKAVLADMVRREKSRDLAAHDPAPRDAGDDDQAGADSPAQPEQATDQAAGTAAQGSDNRG